MYIQDANCSVQSVRRREQFARTFQLIDIRIFVKSFVLHGNIEVETIIFGKGLYVQRLSQISQSSIIALMC